MTRDKYYVTCIIRQQELQGKKYSYIKLIMHRHITIKLTDRICTIQESFTYVQRLGVNRLNMSFERVLSTFYCRDKNHLQYPG
jgi:hypothetical protein